MSEQTLEHCCECDALTGKAGRGDGSLYADNSLGPFCDDCYNREQLPLVEADRDAHLKRADIFLVERDTANKRADKEREERVKAEEGAERAEKEVGSYGKQVDRAELIRSMHIKEAAMERAEQAEAERDAALKAFDDAEDQFAGRIVSAMEEASESTKRFKQAEADCAAMLERVRRLEAVAKAADIAMDSIEEDSHQRAFLRHYEPLVKVGKALAELDKDKK